MMMMMMMKDVLIRRWFTNLFFRITSLSLADNIKHLVIELLINNKLGRKKL